MKGVPSYTKVLTLGSSMTENALIGDILIQEKIDGSQFGFGLNEFKQVVFRSKSVAMHVDNYSDMFKEAIDHVMSIEKIIQAMFPTDTYFYCEYLQKPRHNTLKYDMIPKNHLMLFDCMQKGAWLTRDKLELAASLLQISLIPELWKGDIGVYLREKNEKGYSSPGDFFKRMTETTMSVLGGITVEGVVMKNYNQTILLGGHVFPLFTKYVREAFKEQNALNWKQTSRKGQIEEYIASFQNENRWKKAVYYLKDRGELENSPRDIGNLIRRVNQDIIEEEEQNIKEWLYNLYHKEILRVSTRGLPEWYKLQLIENLNKGGEIK